MTKEQKAQWIKALRSGKYKQCKGRLKSGDRYCCLGVAKKLFDLPDLRSGAGELVSAAFMSSDTQRTLAVMNDKGNSFGEIADYIESRLGPK